MDDWSDTRVITGWALLAALIAWVAMWVAVAVMQTSPENTRTTCVETGRWTPAQCAAVSR